MNVESRCFVTVDGNEAAAYVAHKLSEVIAVGHTAATGPPRGVANNYLKGVGLTFGLPRC